MTRIASRCITPWTSISPLYRTYPIPVQPGQDRWRKLPNGGSRGKPIKKRGSLKERRLTARFRLAVTAVDCMISWNAFLFWWCHFLLMQFAFVISGSWQPFLSTHTLLSWLFFFVFWCHRCLLTPMSFQPLSVDVSFSWHPYLLASRFLETLPDPFSVNLWFMLICFAVRPSILAYISLCLEVVVHSHECFSLGFFPWHLFLLTFS